MWKSSSINTHFLNYFIYLCSFKNNCQNIVRVRSLSKVDRELKCMVSINSRNNIPFKKTTLEITYSLTFIFPLF